MRKKAFLVSLFLISLVVVGALIYVVSNGEERTCDAKAREGKGLTFVKSSDGITHFEIQGDPNAEAIVLIHGVSGPMSVWNKIFPGLVNSGFQVFRYDLFGRGLSDRVSAEYTEDLYDRQLHELISSQNLKKPLTLVGSSMGAVIAAGFRNRHPALVKLLVLIGPAGFPIQASPLSRLIYFPLVGEYFMGVLGTKTLSGHHRKYFHHPDRFPEMQTAFEEQLKFRGTKGAILSTMRRMPVQEFELGYREVGESQIPVLLLWGAHDVTFPFANHTKALTYIPQAKFVPIEEAAHLPQYEAPEGTFSEILNFLAQSTE